MKTLSVGVVLCALLALQGCFDRSDNATKANTDTSKASVQMQQGNSEDKK
jgi:hypothetical protein